MPRGVSLSLCLDRMRAELQHSTSVNAGLNARDGLVRALQGAQETLFFKFSWPQLRVWADKTISAGSRYYDIPAALDVERITTIHHKWGGIWSKPLERGIGLEHYNAFDSDLDVRVDPIQRWDIKDISGSAQIEVHPMPATGITNGLRFIGKRKLIAFNNDADLCDINSEVLIPWAAADYAEKADPKFAAAKRLKATGLARAIVGGGGKSKNRYSFSDGMNCDDDKPRERIIIVSAG